MKLNNFKTALNYLKEFFDSFFLNFSYQIFESNPRYGLLLFIMTLFNPATAVLSLVAHGSAILFGRFIGISWKRMIYSGYTFNSFLLGLAMGFLFELSFLSVFLTIIAAFFTLMLTYTLQHLFAYYLGLPILNLPFTIIATIVYLSSLRYGNLYVAKNLSYSWMNIPELPFWISGLFKATGVLFFLPYDIIGICTLLFMLIFSRINFFLILIGYYSGTLFFWFLKGSMTAAFSDIFSFNFILISLSLGGYFLIPSIKSYLIAVVAVISSVFVMDAVGIFWSSFGIPVFTLPFTIVVLLFYYVLKTDRFHLLTHIYSKSPEHTLEHHLNYNERFNTTTPQPFLPFSGEWKVYQGFDDQWTHKGIWKYAVDFVIENKSDKKTFRNDGSGLEDYYCYKAPILAPVSGTVIDCFDEHKDNPIGFVDKKNNWGNFIIIRSLWNYYIVLAHIATKSITVKSGEWVEAGQKIGCCGSSGYSPQPHIHVHCQYLAALGSYSVPFLFTNCAADGKMLFGTEKLSTGHYVKSMTSSKALQKKFQFILDDTFTFTVRKNGKVLSALTCTVCMDIEGYYYFKDAQSDARLYFAAGEGSFYFYRFEGSSSSKLRFLFLALPRIPFTDEMITWQDSINPTLIKPRRPRGTFFKSFHHQLFKSTGIYSFASADTVEGTITVHSFFTIKTIKTFCSLSDSKGFSVIRITMPHADFELSIVEG